jgi:hypothetical protein
MDRLSNMNVVLLLQHLLALPQSESNPGGFTESRSRVGVWEDFDLLIGDHAET